MIETGPMGELGGWDVYILDVAGIGMWTAVEAFRLR